MTEVVSQNDQTFVDILCKSVRLGTVDENTDKLLKARFIGQSDKNYPHDALHYNALVKSIQWNLMTKFQMTVGIHFP